MTIGRFGACVVACIAAASMAFADDFQKGLEAARAGDFETAFNAWMPLAEGGDPKAQYNIAKMYYLGEFVAVNKVEAARWYLKSAEQGVPAAQRLMGFMYGNGIGVPRDLLKAAQWSNLAAENGDGQGRANLVDIQTELGWAYMGGLDGLEQDLGLACMWFTIASENGDDHAADMAESLCDVAEMTGEAQKLEALTQRCVTSGFHHCE